MSDSLARRGRDRDRRTGLDQHRQRRAHDLAQLSTYLDAVTAALTSHGWLVAHCTVSSSHDLEAELMLRPSTPTSLEPGLAQPVRVRWDEDTGWCVTHHLLGARTPPLHHYLHTTLVPTPSEAARFIAAVLAPRLDPYDPDFAWIGMPYPAQFRYRGQPREPVIDALQRAVNRS